MVPVIVTTWYNEKNATRRAEYHKAIAENLKLGFKMIVLCEDEDRPLVGGLSFVQLDRRPTFEDACMMVSPGDIAIIINTDCFLDHTFTITEVLASGVEAWCLTRRDYGKLHHSPGWSQDCWIFKMPAGGIHGCAFHFGQMACDNAFADVLTKAGFQRRNPCLDIRVHHIHDSQVRHYDRKDESTYVVPRDECLHTPASLLDAPVVSFITPHGNRLEHLKQTIPNNLRVCNDISCEFIICHSADRSGAAQWLQEHHPEVKNVFINGDRFHYARACNHAHKHARGIIQCTLDADQLLTEQYLADLLEAFADGRDCIYHEHNANVANNECAGRISLLRTTFAHIGGYEERFRAWGGVDTELVNRCCDRVKLVNKRRMVGSECIHHGDEIRQKGKQEWNEAKALFEYMKARQIKIANRGVPWGQADDGCVPCHGTWGFNSGILALEDGYLTADRYMDSSEQWSVMLRRFDAQWNEVERALPTELIGMEDMRLIWYNGKILGYGTWAVVNNTGHVWAKKDIHMAMVHINLSPLSASSVVHLSADFPPQGMEKNWILFSYENRLLASYGMRPHLILEVDEQTGKCKRRYISQSLDWKWMWGEPRGGSNWLRIGDHMLMAGHSMLTRSDMETRDLDKALALNKDKYYFAFWVLAEAKPPFKIIAASKDPLGPADGIRSVPTSRYADVCFPMSLWRDGDDVHLAYGEHDERTRVVTLPWEQIRATLVPVARAIAPYGEVRCG